LQNLTKNFLLFNIIDRKITFFVDLPVSTKKNFTSIAFISFFKNALDRAKYLKTGKFYLTHCE